MAARVNLTTKRLALDWNEAETKPQHLIDAVEALGFDARPFSAEIAVKQAGTGRELLTATAVAGFAAANVMLL